MKKLSSIFAFIFLLLLFSAAARAATVIATKAGAMSPGTFADMNSPSVPAGYNFNGPSGSIFVPFPEGGGCGSGDYITQYANGAAYDQARQVIRFFGHSHGSDACEAMRLIRYTFSTNAWDKNIALPGGFSCLVGPSCFNHEWDRMNAIRQSDGLTLWSLGSGAIQYNPATNAWSGVPAPGSIHSGSASPFRYFQDMGKWIHCDADYGCWTLDPANNFSNGWVYIACGTICYEAPQPYSIAESNIHGNSLMAYSNVDHVLYLMTGGTSLRKISSTGVFTQLANCPVTCGLTSANVQVDPVSGHIILIGGNNVMYAFNPNSGLQGSWSPTGVTPPAVFAVDSRVGSSNGPGDGLVGTALPDLGVIWYAKYVGTGSNGVFLYKHAPAAPDTTPPTAPSGLTVTPVSPTQLNIAWNPSFDAGGIINYFVERSPAGCGAFAQVGAPVGPSFSDTGLLASTPYCYRVRGTDAVPLLGPYSSNATATTQAAGGSDFTTRCAAAGVLRCFGFDTNADLGATGGGLGPYANVGNFHNSQTPCNTSFGVDDCPTIDTSIKASGAGSMKFVMPVGSGADWGGQWFANFSSDNSIQFGAGQDFYIQWRERFDSNYVNNEWTDAGGAYPKLAIVTLGDLPGCNVNNASLCRSSNPNTAKIVFEDSKRLHYPMLYGPGTGDDPYQDLVTGQLGFQDFRPQNARPSPGCWNYWYNTPSPGSCFRYAANEWMTFSLHVHLGNLSGGFWVNSLVEMRMGREGQPTEAVVSINHDIATNGEKFGKIWLLPYMTGKTSADKTSPTAFTWYDELIISSLPIADPGGAPNPPSAVTLSQAKRRIQ